MDNLTIERIKTGGRKVSSVKERIFYVVIVAAMIPDIGIKVNLFGVSWIFYRVVIVFSFFTVVVLDGGKIIFKRRTYSHKWLILLITWIGYGIILLLCSRYVNMHNGIVELISILNAALLIYIASSIPINKTFINRCINIIIAIEILFILVGFFEIITGMHLSSSMIEDKTIMADAPLMNKNVATGMMYNMNDFSAFITLLLPFCMNTKWIRIPMIAAVALINQINDANICNLAIIVGIGCYFLFFINTTKKRKFSGKIIIVIAASVAILIGALLEIDILSNFNLVSRIQLMIDNAKHSTGSLYMRLVMYKDLLAATVDTYGFGLGPKAIQSYFESFPSKSKLVNPHSLFLEILAQYGVIIFCWFGIRIVKMFKEGYVKLKEGLLEKYDRLVLELILTYVIVSFASSNFLGYSYQWAIIAIICCMLQMDKEGHGYRAQKKEELLEKQ